MPQSKRLFGNPPDPSAASFLETKTRMIGLVDAQAKLRTAYAQMEGAFDAYIQSLPLDTDGKRYVVIYAPQEDGQYTTRVSPDEPVIIEGDEVLPFKSVVLRDGIAARRDAQTAKKEGKALVVDGRNDSSIHTVLHQDDWIKATEDAARLHLECLSDDQRNDNLEWMQRVRAVLDIDDPRVMEESELRFLDACRQYDYLAQSHVRAHQQVLAATTKYNSDLDDASAYTPENGAAYIENQRVLSDKIQSQCARLVRWMLDAKAVFEPALPVYKLTQNDMEEFDRISANISKVYTIARVYAFTEDDFKTRQADSQKKVLDLLTKRNGFNLPDTELKPRQRLELAKIDNALSTEYQTQDQLHSMKTLALLPPVTKQEEFRRSDYVMEHLVQRILDAQDDMQDALKYMYAARSGAYKNGQLKNPRIVKIKNAIDRFGQPLEKPSLELAETIQAYQQEHEYRLNNPGEHLVEEDNPAQPQDPILQEVQSQNKTESEPSPVVLAENALDKRLAWLATLHAAEARNTAAVELATLVRETPSLYKEARALVKSDVFQAELYAPANILQKRHLMYVSTIESMPEVNAEKPAEYWQKIEPELMAHCEDYGLPPSNMLLSAAQAVLDNVFDPSAKQLLRKALLKYKGASTRYEDSMHTHDVLAGIPSAIGEKAQQIKAMVADAARLESDAKQSLRQVDEILLYFKPEDSTPSYAQWQLLVGDVKAIFAKKPDPTPGLATPSHVNDIIERRRQTASVATLHVLLKRVVGFIEAADQENENNPEYGAREHVRNELIGLKARSAVLKSFREANQHRGVA